MESFEGVDIFFDEDSFKPLIICNKRINFSPEKYKIYGKAPKNIYYLLIFVYSVYNK